MLHPFQCLLICTLAHRDKPTILLGATKSRILSFSLHDGRLLSIWQSNLSQIGNDQISGDPLRVQTGAEERPAKRQRKASPDDASESSSAEIVTEDGKPRPSKSTKARVLNANVIDVAATSDGHYIIAVTDEDKCLRVLQLNANGALQQLSKRSMPKKPCAITLTPDETTIICGDKFGDVYALPLLPNKVETEPVSAPQANDVEQEDDPPVVKKFLPSANSKTVHTLRNQKALRHQKSLTSQKSNKNVTAFEHKLLLGHVSLLTDVTYVSVPHTEINGSQSRTYIITADRDEHIRVSRGIPQAHVIEGFCLGHTQFVSQLCVPSWNKRLLISGGGDNYLLIWEWLSGRVLHRVDLRNLMSDFLQRHGLSESRKTQQKATGNPQSDWNELIAVSKIIALETNSAGGILRRHVIVICERLPCIIFFSMDGAGALRFECSKAAQGNVADIACSTHEGCVVYAVDTVHEAFSQTLVVEGDVQPGRSGIGLLRFSAVTKSWEKDSAFEEAVAGAIEIMTDFDVLKNDLLLRTARGEQVERPPIWVMRQAGRYLPEYHEAKGNNDFFACCRSPEIASTLTLQPIDRYDGLIDAAIIFSDILVIPQAMGMVVEMLDKKGPHFPNPLTSPPDEQYEQLMDRTVDVAKELDYVYRAITLTRRKLKGRVPLYGFCGAPWTLLCYMVEGGGSKLFVQVKTWIYKHPDQSKKLLQKIAELCVEYLALQVKAGAQIVQVFDSWAAELSPTSFREFALPYLRHISKHLPQRLMELHLEVVPMVVFAKGAWYALDDLCASGYQVVGLDWLQDPAEAVRIARGREVVLQGNADPGVLYGDKEAITAVVHNMVQGFGGGKQGWIANLGHGVTPFVKPDNLKFFFEELHRLTTTANHQSTSL
ncbi:MAG: hypothetical protein Q9218_000544 [Villophora microphyllina]